MGWLKTKIIKLGLWFLNLEQSLRAKRLEQKQILDNIKNKKD